MAEIFLAELKGEQDVSKLCAIKRMLPHLMRDPSFVAMFLDEARLSSRLSHPNIVQVFDFGEVESRYFIAMEYLAGENLNSILTRLSRSGQFMPLQVVLQVLIGICDGLHYAHEYREKGKDFELIHRDISPSNIILTFQGGMKLLDFGIARASERQQEQTRTGVVKGKLPYCSPEQMRSETLDRRSDIFSLGAVLHEALTNRRLFGRPNEAGTLHAVLMDPIPPPSALRKDLPAEVDRIALKALARAPAERYQTALEFRRDLERLLFGPPVRLDEYLNSVYGNEHVAERLAMSISSVAKVPTAVDTPRQAAGSRPSAQHAHAQPQTLTVESKELSPRKAALHLPQKPRRMVKAALGGAIAGVALVATALIAFQQARTPVPEPVTTKLPAGPARLHVSTQPAGARVSLCGQPLEGVTPLQLEVPQRGRCTLVATLEGHEPAERLTSVEAGQTTEETLSLTPRPVLTVDAPKGALVELDGEKRGQERRFALSAGDHRLRIELAGHRAHEQVITLAAGEQRQLAVTLTPVKKAGTGLLDVACLPWCRVLLDGVDVGKPSPIVGLPVSAGRHTLRMEHPPSGKMREVRIDVKPGLTVRETSSFR